MSEFTLAERVEKIRKHARRYRKYDNWQLLDGFDDATIADLIRRTRTERGAVLKVMAAIKLIADDIAAAEKAAKTAAALDEAITPEDLMEVRQKMAEMRVDYEAEVETQEVTEPTPEEIAALEAEMSDAE